MHSTTALTFVIVGMLLIYWAVPAFRGANAGTGTAGTTGTTDIARETRPVFPYNPAPRQPIVRTGSAGNKLK